MANKLKKLKQITSKEAREKGYKLLGQGWGTNLEYCIYEGVLHCKNFEKRAKYYVILSHIKSGDPRHKFASNTNEVMLVEFYE